MRIGIFGGSFDPPHIGHSKIAVMAKNEFNLDKLIMIPTGITPHKETSGEMQCRYNMCEIVAKKYGFEISDYEINKKTYCYSFETLEYLKSVYTDDEIYFIIGGDSIKNIDKWKNPQRIFGVAKVIVASRDEGTDRAIAAAEDKYNAKIYLLKNENIDVSSTEIRKMITQGKNAGGCLEPEVLTYINENNLYR